MTTPPPSIRWIVTSTAAAGRWDEAAERDAITLTYDERYRRRFLATTEGGHELLVDLPEAVALRDGDGLALDGGGSVRVRAAAEPVADIACPDDSLLVRIAWHLGNRHLPVELHPGGLRIRQDHVIEEMVRGHGASVSRLDAPFQPEGGAYADTSHH